MPRIQNIFKIFKVRETGNVEFWVSNAVILFSTVLGVYLAAQAGYGTAVQFEVTRAERENYFMRRALLDEVKKNLDAVDRWGNDFEKMLRDTISKDYFKPDEIWTTYYFDHNGYEHSAPDSLKMKIFVWETMKQQSVTLQLPPALISAVRDYYDSMEESMKDVSKRNWNGAKAVRTVIEESKKMRETFLPVFEKDAEELQARLAAKGVPLS